MMGCAPSVSTAAVDPLSLERQSSLLAFAIAQEASLQQHQQLGKYTNAACTSNTRKRQGKPNNIQACETPTRYNRMIVVNGVLLL